LRPVTVGDQWVFVVSVGDYHVGDMVCSPSQECHKVVGVVLSQPLQLSKRQDGGQEIALQIDGSWSASYAVGTEFATEVDPNVERTNPVPVTTNSQFFDWSSDASTMAASFAVFFALLALLM